MSVDRTVEFVRSKLSSIGQVSGYSTFLASLGMPQTAVEWVELLKGIVGLIGLAAGGALSCWALYDKWKTKRAEKLRNKQLD
jgi:hypothetical protein